jgi:hypothetical protein
MEMTAMNMETAMHSQQYIVTEEPGSVATLYVKGSADVNATRRTINMLYTLPGIIKAETSADQLPLITVGFDPQQIRGGRIVKSLSQVGYQRSCIAIMYFKDSTDNDSRRNAEETVIAQPGVIAAERSALKAHVLIVHFDPFHTQGSRIVNVLSKNGYSAMLVGC